VAALKRKLTTILCADVAGYSLLMSRDEETTHARLAALFREVLEPAIAAHGGTLVKTTGDGFLSEFVSVVEAMRCASEIQHAVTELSNDYPSDQAILFRIGINLGDVIHDNDDIFGDGVIIASRLEGLAERGGIVVSQAVRDHVHDKLGLSFEDMGEQRLKNIERPVRAFRVRSEADEPPRSLSFGRRHIQSGAVALAVALGVSVIAGLWWFDGLGSLSAWTAPLLRSAALPEILRPPRPAQLSIVVLPFANLGGDPQQDYFVDGITESLTTDLSRALPGSFVVTRGTAFTYKGKPVDARQIGRDLNVRYLLQGSVLTDGDQVSVNAQLIEADSNNELWA